MAKEANEPRDDAGPPARRRWKAYTRSALQIASATPFVGGLFSAAAGQWSEREQGRINEFLQGCIEMLEDELREKHDTIAGIMSRLDLQDERISNRIHSDEFQSLLKKAFRNWAGTESKKKQEYIRNILTNAAAETLTSDDVVSLFVDWLQNYSEFHFAVIGEIYKNPGATRLQIWRNLGKGQPREDSAEADLYKLLFRDLSTGGVIRQHRETDYAGNFVAKKRSKPARGGGDRGRLKSAFDDAEPYELTALGRQFVHYAMTELTVKIEFRANMEEGDSAGED